MEGWGEAQMAKDEDKKGWATLTLTPEEILKLHYPDGHPDRRIEMLVKVFEEKTEQLKNIPLFPRSAE